MSFQILYERLAYSSPLHPPLPYPTNLSFLFLSLLVGVVTLKSFFFFGAPPNLCVPPKIKISLECFNSRENLATLRFGALSNHLFHQDKDRNPSKIDSFKSPEIEFEFQISSSKIRGPVFEFKKEDEIKINTDSESAVLDELILNARNSNANPIEEIIQKEEAIVIEPELEMEYLKKKLWENWKKLR